MQHEADGGDDGPGLIPCLVAPMGDAKEILAACLDAEIEASLARGACCGTSGCACAPKMQLMVAPEDVPRVAKLLQSRWDELLEREGVDFGDEEGSPAGAPGLGAAAGDAASDNPPCPACGTAAPLVEGACSDCGLQLE